MKSIKPIAMLISAVALSGCSNQDLAMFNSAVNQMNGGGSCAYQDQYGSTEYMRYDDGSVYLAFRINQICDSIYFILESRDSVPMRCTANVNRARGSAYLKPYGEAELSFRNPGGRVEFGMECEDA